MTVANRQAEAQTRQAELGRRDHIAELFNRAIGQLKDEKLEVRLGAIFTLLTLAADAPKRTLKLDLSGVDCSNVLFRGANLLNANLDGAILRSADLSNARNLTRSQIERAIIDVTTILPGYLIG